MATDQLPPFLQAAKDGDLETLKDLCSKGEDVNMKSKDKGNTALHFAAKEGRLEIIKVLLEQPKIQIDSINNKGRTPLIMAAKHIECGKLISFFFFFLNLMRIEKNFTFLSKIITGKRSI